MGYCISVPFKFVVDTVFAKITKIKALQKLQGLQFTVNYSNSNKISIFPWENVILLVILTCGTFLHITNLSRIYLLIFRDFRNFGKQVPIQLIG
jgi:hypothetical protein